MDYRPDIDGLRAIAVLAVVFYHLDFHWFSGGFVGVDIFFVISGYLITNLIVKNATRGTFSFLNFYSRRIRRLAPALLATVAGTFLFSALLMSPATFQGMAGQAAASILSVANIFLWKESGYFDAESITKPLLHTWSLSVEEQFYMFWPLLVYGLVKFRQKIHPLIVLLLLSLFSLFFAEWFLDSKESAVFYLTPFRVFEFCIGAFLVWIPGIRARFLWVRQFLFIAGIFLMMAPVLLFSKDTRFPGLLALIPCLGAAFCIYSEAVGLTGKLVRNVFAVRTGLLSYSIYLAHWPIIVFYSYLKSDPLDLQDKFLILGLTFGISVLMYRYVETPFRRPKVRRRLFGSISAFPVGVGAVILGVLSLSIHAWIQDGWTWRVPSYEKLISNHGVSPKNFHKAFYGGNKCNPPRCSTNRENRKSVVYVVGDSYARAYYHGLATVFPNEEFVFWENAGCEFFSISYIGSSTKNRKRCEKIKREAYAEIANSLHPVLLGQHWNANFEETQRIQKGYQGKNLKFKEIDEYANFVVRELRTLKKELNLSKLIVIGGPPKFGYKSSPLDCVLVPIGGDRCQQTLYNNVTLWHKRFHQALIAAGWKSEDLINPYEVLCDNNGCKNFLSSGYPIYSDYGHLSIWGSEYVVVGLQPQLSSLFSRR